MKKLILVLAVIVMACTENAEKVAPKPEISGKYQGGTVFYILKSTDYGYVKNEIHGFIASDYDLGGYIWGCASVSTLDLIEDIGYGDYNTEVITGICNDVNSAYICYSLELNGYNDWFLPNEKEFNIMIDNKIMLNLSLSEYYWTSSKGSNPVSIRPSDGDIIRQNYQYKHIIRPIRKF